MFHENWFSDEDKQILTHLYDMTAGVDGAVIEVGCWEGCSTCTLANACHPDIVHAVDTWRGAPGDPAREIAKQRNVYAIFKANIVELTAGNVKPHRMGWRPFFAKWHEPIRFLHIDAEHTAREVRENIVAASPLMAPGGVMCGHDAGWPEVQEGVRQGLGELTLLGQLWWWQKET